MNPARFSDWFHPATIALLAKLLKVLIVPAAGGGGWLTRKWLLSRASHWPIVPGRVQGFVPNTEGALCNVLYSYSVDGEYFSGELPIRKNRVFRTKEDVSMLLPIDSLVM